MKVREGYVSRKKGAELHYCTVCGKRAEILHKDSYFCSERCKNHYKEYNNQFPYTPDTICHICLWHYTDGIEGLASNRKNTKDVDASIWSGVPLRVVKNIIEKCKKDGSYDRNIKTYKTYMQINTKPKQCHDGYSVFGHCES